MSNYENAKVPMFDGEEESRKGGNYQ